MEYGDNVILTGQSELNNGSGPGNASFAGPHVSQAWIGTYPENIGNSNVSPSQKAAYATIHETLHLLGLSDRYGQSGFMDDWMSEYSDNKADLLVTLSKEHIINMVKIALSLNPKSAPYKNSVNWGKQDEKVTIYENQGAKTNADAAVDKTVQNPK